MSNKQNYSLCLVPLTCTTTKFPWSQLKHVLNSKYTLKIDEELVTFQLVEKAFFEANSLNADKTQIAEYLKDIFGIVMLTMTSL